MFPTSLTNLLNNDCVTLANQYIEDAIKKTQDENIFIPALEPYEAENHIITVQCFFKKYRSYIWEELPEHIQKIETEEMTGELMKLLIKLPDENAAIMIDLYETVDSMNILMVMGFLECANVFDLLQAPSYQPDNYEIPKRFVLDEESIARLTSTLNEDIMSMTNPTENDFWNRIKGDNNEISD